MNKQNLVMFLISGIVVCVALYWLVNVQNDTAYNTYEVTTVDTKFFGGSDYSQNKAFKPYKQKAYKANTSQKNTTGEEFQFSSGRHQASAKNSSSTTVYNQSEEASTFGFSNSRISKREQQDNTSLSLTASSLAYGSGKTANNNQQFVAMNANGVTTINSSVKNTSGTSINQLGTNPGGGDDGWDDLDDDEDPIGVVPVGEAIWFLLISAMAYVFFISKRKWA